MHPEVIFEVREKTPTPALNGKAQENYYKFLKGQLDETQSSSSKKRKGN